MSLKNLKLYENRILCILFLIHCLFLKFFNNQNVFSFNYDSISLIFKSFYFNNFGVDVYLKFQRFEVNELFNKYLIILNQFEEILYLKYIFEDILLLNLLQNNIIFFNSKLFYENFFILFNIKLVNFLFFDFFFYICLNIFLIISVLISVAFFTLLERKVMASMQRRKGPDNRITGIWGVLQPIADGLKLLFKEIVVPKRATKIFFIGAPLYTFLISLLGWCVIPWSSQIILIDFQLSVLYLFGISSLGVYGILLSGWSSNSKYAFLGSLRSSAQMISYEVSFAFILIIISLFSGSYNFHEIIYKQESLWYCVPLLPLVLIFFVSMLAETNRAPFDLPEAEAELVSGYNTEYSSIIFAMFFLGEYSNMLLMSSVFVIFFFGGWLNFEIKYFPKILETFWFFFKVCFIAFIYVWVRATLPRYRYNQLMNIGWMIFLPLTLGLLAWYLGFLLYIDGLPLNNSSLSIYFIENFFLFSLNKLLPFTELVFF